MARDLARHLAPGGSAILSGLLDRQASAVIDAHRAAGLRLRRRIQLETWSTLVLTAPRRRRQPFASSAVRGWTFGRVSMKG